MRITVADLDSTRQLVDPFWFTPHDVCLYAEAVTDDAADTSGLDDIVIGRTVAEYRSHARMTLEDVARHMTEFGFPWQHSTVWKVERGRRSLRASELPALAEALGVQVGDILSVQATPLLDVKDRLGSLATAADAVKDALATYALERRSLDSLPTEVLEEYRKHYPDDWETIGRNCTVRASADRAAASIANAVSVSHFVDAPALWAEERAGKTPLTGEDILNM